MRGRKTDNDGLDLENVSKEQLIRHILKLTKKNKKLRDEATKAKFTADFQFLKSTHENLELQEKNVSLEKDNQLLKKELILTREKLAEVINKGVPAKPKNSTYRLFTIRPVVIDLPRARAKEEKNSPTLG